MNTPAQIKHNLYHLLNTPVAIYVNDRKAIDDIEYNAMMYTENPIVMRQYCSDMGSINDGDDVVIKFKY